MGANGWKRFWSITLPLTTPGYVSGALLVFIWTGHLDVQEEGVNLPGLPQPVQHGRSVFQLRLHVAARFPQQPGQARPGQGLVIRQGHPQGLHARAFMVVSPSAAAPPSTVIRVCSSVRGPTRSRRNRVRSAA